MIFETRTDVERVGRARVEQERDGRGLRALQLGVFWLYVDEDDSGYTKHALNDGFWEAWITLWMDKNVRSGSTVVDIGANHGYYSFFLASRKCKVFAFEPQPRLAELIRRSEEQNHLSVNVEELAVSDSEGVINMMVPINHGMNATISNQFSYAPNGYTTIEVETVTLDNMFDTIEIDFIKVDAEGAEDLIWAGSKEFRKRQSPVWLMEWRYDRYKNPEAFAQDIFSTHDVTTVDFDGQENPVSSPDYLYTVKHEDWMLVLRPKA